MTSEFSSIFVVHILSISYTVDNGSSELERRMASLRFWVCLILVFLSISGFESRPLVQFSQRRNPTTQSLRMLVEGAKVVFKVREEVDGSQDKLMRVSPGGPDPLHH
ncbi:hypothetical protein HHK36_023577 [Tetracentron sinense]|uniref:Uncharacterized protein n=1 Tax=Tetracentron sinense TaxID=13715 RepID=A0A834YQD6_TETSI|nr:hypothetical protein HHK36_023577 [Tetracentron sinense]